VLPLSLTACALADYLLAVVPRWGVVGHLTRLKALVWARSWRLAAGYWPHWLARVGSWPFMARRTATDRAASRCSKVEFDI